MYCHPIPFYTIVYHMGPDGWKHVWATDTHEMFFKYYPVGQVQVKSIVDTEEALKA